MFVCNLKISKTTLSKIFLGIIFLLVAILLFFTMYRLFHFKTFDTVPDTIHYKEVNTITANHYTNVLKTVHEHLDDYVGQKISFTGYVYRVYDLKQSEFVLARDMIISSDFQTLVVGFLCEYENALNFSDGTWVSITATIKKGEYHGEIPILEIEHITKIDKPNDEYVYPPDDGFVPTHAIL